MSQRTPNNPAVYEFVDRELDSVPHLEALLLLWHGRPKFWTIPQMGEALYVNDSYARDILANLTRRHLATRSEPESYAYNDSPERNALIAALEFEYSRNLIHITRMIHAKASPSVREFADAFRLKKDRET